MSGACEDRLAMHKYRSFAAWRRAHEVVLLAFRATDRAYHPRSRALFDQLKRAALSVELNVVEGYALGSTAQFRRHLRIAIGSAAETEAIVRTAAELEYLDPAVITRLLHLTDGTLAVLYGLLHRGEPLPAPRSRYTSSR